MGREGGVGGESTMMTKIAEGEVQHGQRLGGKGDKGMTEVMIAGG